MQRLKVSVSGLGPAHTKTVRQRANLRLVLADDPRGRLADDDRRWSPRSTMLLAGGVSLAAWGALAWGVLSVL